MPSGGRRLSVYEPSTAWARRSGAHRPVGAAALPQAVPPGAADPRGTQSGESTFAQASAACCVGGTFGGMADDHESDLAGGASGIRVVRVGHTVRRPLHRNSAFVHALLLHLEAVGFEGAPRFLGIDEEGREILSYVEGRVYPGVDEIDDRFEPLGKVQGHRERADPGQGIPVCGVWAPATPLAPKGSAQGTPGRVDSPSRTRRNAKHGCGPV
jgi:hypothetical protein